MAVASSFGSHNIVLYIDFSFFIFLISLTFAWTVYFWDYSQRDALILPKSSFDFWLSRLFFVYIFFIFSFEDIDCLVWWLTNHHCLLIDISNTSLMCADDRLWLKPLLKGVLNDSLKLECTAKLTENYPAPGYDQGF